MSFSRVAHIEIPLPVARRGERDEGGRKGGDEGEEAEGASFVTRNPPWTN